MRERVFAFWWCIVLALMPSCAGGIVNGNDGPGEPTTPPAAPTVAQHGIFEPCGGARHTVENPFGLRRALRMDPVAFYRDLFHRAMEIKAIQGSARVVVHMPNGWDRAGMGYSCQSLAAMEPERRTAFLAFVARCDAADVSTGVYICSRVSDRGVTRTNNLDALQPMSVFDYDNPLHRKAYVERTIDPYVEAGVDEFWFDAASKSDRIQSFVKLAADLRARGLVVRMEAIPTIDDDSGIVNDDDDDDREPSGNPRVGQPDVNIVNAVGGAAGLDRFWYLREHKRGWSAGSMPDGPEYVCIISGHQKFDGSVPTNPAARDVYLSKRMRLRFGQGLSVFYLGHQLHERFMQALSDHIESGS